MRFSKYHFAVLALIGTNIIWGASIPIFRWSLESVTPFTFAFLRFFLATVMLLPFTLHQLKISRHDVISLFVLAIVGFFLHIGLLLVGLSTSSSVNSSVIATAAPIFLIMGSILFYKETVRTRIIVGTVISLLGVCIIILRPIIDVGLDGTITGNILFLLSTIAFVGYTFILKHYVTHLRPVTVTFYLFAFATLIFFPFFLMESSQHQVLQTLNQQALIGIVFGAVFTSIFGYLFYNFGVKYIKASEIGVFLYVDPLVTVLVAIPLLGEKITPAFLLGALFVFVGIYVAERRIHYHPIHKLFQNNEHD